MIPPYSMGAKQTRSCRRSAAALPPLFAACAANGFVRGGRAFENAKEGITKKMAYLYSIIIQSARNEWIPARQLIMSH
mgnify:FL=1